VHSIDSNVTVGMRFSKDTAVTVGVDIFNLFNFQQVTSYDQNFTTADVLPIPNGSVDSLPKAGDPSPTAGQATNCPNPMRTSDGLCFDPVNINPNYNNPSGYQQPRQIRINARVTF
jgi:hypothetical protein